MKTVLVCAAQAPFITGGAEILVSELKANLERRGFRADVASVPFKWYPVSEIVRQALAWRLLDVTESNGTRVDLVIPTKFPTFLVRHPRKVAWLFHQHREAYDRIFDRVGLEWYRVESDVGMMGGFGAHEYMAPCPAGENEVALSESGYAANVEVASAVPQRVDGLPEPLAEPRPVETPGATTIDAVSDMLGVPAGALIKAFPMFVDGSGPALVVVRGDHRLNEIKLANALRAHARPAEADEVREVFGTEPGFIGPVGAPVRVVADEALRDLRGLVAGGNEHDVHLIGVEPGRDFQPSWADVRRVESGDTGPDGGTIRVEPAIEVGNIFKLGTRYAEVLGARYLDEEGREQLIWMGSYGIGPARIVAAAIEQFHDEQGIAWPRSVAPFDVELVTLGKEGEEARELAEQALEGQDLPAREAEQWVRRAGRGAEREELLLALEELGAWYRDLVAVAVGAERAAIHVDRLEALREDAAPERSAAAETAAGLVRQTWRELEELQLQAPLAFEALFVQLRRAFAGSLVAAFAEGKAIVASGTSEKCELDVSRLHAYGLWATMQQD